MPPKKPSKAKGQWGLIRILEGDPYGCEGPLRSAMGSGEMIRLSDADSDAALSTALTGFRFGDKPLAVMRTPSEEQLTLLTKYADGGRLTCSGVIVAYPCGYADGRKTFTKKVKAEGGIVTKEFTREQNTETVRKHVSNFCQSTGVRFEPQAMEWMLANKPVFETKVKDTDGRSGATAVAVVDFMALFGDLHKLAVLMRAEGRSVFSRADVESVWSFRGENSLFDVSDAIMAGDLATAWGATCEIIRCDEDGAVGFAMGLVSILRTAGAVMRLVERGGRDPERIAREATLAAAWDRYPGVEWNKSDDCTAPQPLNRWRVERIMRECQLSSSELDRACVAFGYAIDSMFAKAPPEATMGEAVFSAMGYFANLPPAYRELAEP